jgi:hypothetical protein
MSRGMRGAGMGRGVGMARRPTARRGAPAVGGGLGGLIGGLMRRR